MMMRSFLLAIAVLIGTTLTLRADAVALCASFDTMIEALDVKGARQAIEQAYKEAPSSYDVLYRMARLNIILGDQEKIEDSKLPYYTKGVEYADKALAANGKGMSGYVYRAAANGKVALFKGIFSVGGVVNKVRDDAWTAIKLNNETPQRLASAHYILGRAHLNLTKKAKILRYPLGLAWGNIEEAYENLKKARELRPDFIMFELEYARVLIAMDRDEEGKTVARRIAGLSPKEPGDKERKNDALELLK
jgi:tetratricopeptide (TPR) repeat protein